MDIPSVSHNDKVIVISSSEKVVMYSPKTVGIYSPGNSLFM
jgi:hypothetical protein